MGAKKLLSGPEGAVARIAWAGGRSDRGAGPNLYGTRPVGVSPGIVMGRPGSQPPPDRHAGRRP